MKLIWIVMIKPHKLSAFLYDVYDTLAAADAEVARLSHPVWELTVIKWEVKR